jgi:UDP-N-acetyl-D-mannosaminuronate dehydrogenase
MTVLAYKVPIIKIVETVKVIGYKLLDLYILLINELLIVFRKINIVIKVALDTAGSKFPRYFLKVLYK